MMRKRETVDAAAASPFKFLSYAHGAITDDTFVMPPSTVVVFGTPAGTSSYSAPSETGVVKHTFLYSEPHVLADMLYQRHGTYSVTYGPGETVPEMTQVYGCERHEYMNNSMGVYRLPLLKPIAGRTKELGQKKGQLVGRPGLGGQVLLSAVLRDLPALAGVTPTPQNPLVVFVHSCRGIWWNTPPGSPTTRDAKEAQRFAECARLNQNASGIGGWCSPRPGRLDPTAMSLAEIRKCSKEQHTACHESIGIDWKSILGKAGANYRASSSRGETDRRERLSRAVRSLADASFDGDARAAAKSLGQRLAFMSRKEKHADLLAWKHLRENKDWLRDTYCPSTARRR